MRSTCMKSRRANSKRCMPSMKAMSGRMEQRAARFLRKKWSLVSSTMRAVLGGMLVRFGVGGRGSTPMRWGIAPGRGFYRGARRARGRERGLRVRWEFFEDGGVGGLPGGLFLGGGFGWHGR